jgi:PAS domain-containing protein
LSVQDYLPAGIAVLDETLSIHLWNGQAEDLWGVRAEEVQGHFFLTCLSSPQGRAMCPCFRHH